jgi:methylamine dehydrogenase accessory protein MauD
LAVVQYLSIRQIGIMLSRLGPIGARSVDSEGPRTGEFIAKQMNGIRGILPHSTSDVLYLFGSKACSVCKDVRLGAAKLVPHWSSEVVIVFLYDESSASASELTFDQEAGMWIFYNSFELRESLRIQAVPFGVLVDEDDRVIGKGLVNTISHVESLLELTVGLHNEKKEEPSHAI